NVGAELWHMNAFEGLFGLGGVTWPCEPGTGSCAWLSVLTLDALNTGAAILVGTDGHRFLNESEVVRHGHLYENGVWENPSFSEHTWYIFDETQKALIEENGLIPQEEWASVKAFDTVEAMAAELGCKDLAETIENFNAFAANGKDYTCGRAAEHMRAFDGKKYYAKYVYQGLLNTQGGPKRNVNAEILDTQGNAIPHLYSAGEMGGITACMYQGGTNVAECIIFGEIAGKNAAAAKEALPVYAAAAKVESKPLTLGMENDMTAEKTYEAGDGQYVGVGKGLMGDVVVRVTMADGAIAAVEVIEQNETATIAGPALETIPNQFIGMKTAEEVDAIDAVSGATVTSGALKEAVKNALAQVK
ncbi:MAG: FMN-binding protein, partial [Eubacteriales bacterium]|nr:FMN-binding protein [Eubacteriales bacterium]